MKVGIIVHSKSGNTFNVARKIASKCTEKKIDADIIKLNFEGDVAPRAKTVKLVEPPLIDKFDFLVIGGPVWAFTASPVITAYLQSIKSFKDKKVMNFVTMGFPLRFLGGNGAVALMNKIVSANGGTIIPGEVITMKDLKTNLETIVDRMFSRIK